MYGGVLWSRTYPVGESISVIDLRLDHDGNSFVLVKEDGQPDSLLIKHGPTGKLLWAKYLRIHADTLQVDRRGSAYVVGDFERDVTIAKFGPGGDRRWTRRFNSNSDGFDTVRSRSFEMNYMERGGRSSDRNSAALDSRNNLVVLTNSEGSEWNRDSLVDDLVILKFRPDGKRIWTRRHQTPRKNKVRAHDIEIDRDDNIVLGATTRDEHFYIVKYSPAGRFLWASKYGNGTQTLHNLSINRSNKFVSDIYAAGLESGDRQEKFLLVKLGPDGTHKWARSGTGVDRAKKMGFVDVVVNSDGWAFIAGSAWTTQDWSQSWEQKNILIGYSAKGRQFWNKSGSSGTSTMLAADKSGHIYHGYTRYNDTYNYGLLGHLFTAKYHP